MRCSSLSIFAVSLVFSLFSGALGLNNFIERAEDTTDICGEVDDYLKVPNILLPGKFVTIGKIEACLCLSTLPQFMISNIYAITASALAGKSNVIDIISDMIKNCNGHQTCHYPPHSVPMCQHGNPCGFTCKDGYSPFPSSYPTTCVCNKPNMECNGKCGKFYACPSGYVKRDLRYDTEKQCPKGYTACGVPGRGAGSWECLNTQTDLESCGGCTMPLHSNLLDPEGEDCTAIAGISDVSCIQGKCVVHRCMPGYDINGDGSSCIYVEDKDPVILAAQYGLEHVPF